MRDISRMTTGETTFGANQAVEIEQTQQMATSLDNLATASIQKNATIYTMSRQTLPSPRPSKTFSVLLPR
jgi:hypothetical protein